MIAAHPDIVISLFEAEFLVGTASDRHATFGFQKFACISSAAEQSV